MAYAFNDDKNKVQLEFERTWTDIPIASERNLINRGTLKYSVDVSGTVTIAGHFELSANAGQLDYVPIPTAIRPVSYNNGGLGLYRQFGRCLTGERANYYELEIKEDVLGISLDEPSSTGDWVMFEISYNPTF